MKEYKPILVFYFKESLSQDYLERVKKELERVTENTGYNTILIQECSENKVELLSVDKATIVEDIQKYIDLNFSSKEKIMQNIEKVIEMQ